MIIKKLIKNKKRKVIMKSEQMRIKFGGENDIDLSTLSKSLNSTVDVLKLIADKTVSENDFCKFKVKNIEKGSFVIDIEQVLMLAPTLLSTMPTVLSTFKDILEIRKFLHGEKPKSIIKGNQVTQIENNQGQVSVYNDNSVNIYVNSQKIENGMAKIAGSVLRDESRTSLDFDFDCEKEKSEISFDKQELTVLSKVQDINNFEGLIEENKMTTDLIVKKPDFSGNSKWTFKLLGKDITAEIDDEEFLSVMKRDEFLFNGSTTMNVDMTTRFKIVKDNKGESIQKIIDRKITKVNRIF